MSPGPAGLTAMQVVGCDGCGATLPVTPGSLEVTCLFCGASRQVDPGLATALEALPAQALAHEKVGLDSLEEAHLRDLRPGPPAMLGAIGASFSAIVLSVPVVGLTGQLDQTLGMVLLLTCPLLSLALPAAWFAGQVVLAPSRTKRILAQIRAEAAAAPHRGACPRCGAPVVVPNCSARLACTRCDAAIMAADGLLVAWVEDARARSDAWRTEARRVARAHYQRTVWRSNVLGLASVGVPLLLMVSMLICGALLEELFG